LPAWVRRLRKRWAIERGGIDVLVVASRGVWTPAERRHQERRLSALARRVSAISDVEAAHLGALGERPGILLLAGTGSIALGRDGRGRWARAGGWGPLLGDEGSAFWIGREWLRAAIRAAGMTRARRLLRSPDPVARIAALAPSVLRRADSGSPAARRVVALAQRALADLLVESARQLRLRPPIAVSWAGGLLDDRRFRAGVWRAVRGRRIQIEPAAPLHSPAMAVSLVADRLAGDLSRPRPARSGGRARTSRRAGR
ncbi:MAG TPA: BadF/BadG/BcrA/BcrD ATPase family protein, partial [Candidatus Methylomirabilis sp.]|nr:BadF/BadG/BcrA/BcrD ATPase family protein [Candidatus Methylomirabilis sp.]